MVADIKVCGVQSYVLGMTMDVDTHMHIYLTLKTSSFFRMRCILENISKERGMTPHLRNAFGMVDNSIFGELC